MKKIGMKDFADVFKLPPTLFPLGAGSISLEDFLNLTEEVDIEFDLYEECKPMLMAMMAITPSSDLEEKEAIFAALNGNRSVENYIYEHFTDELEQFYVCESKFWEHWCASVNFGKEESLGLKLDHKQIIENGALVEPKHAFRLKDNLEFMTDYLLLPKFVFWPLSKWYACDKEIERVVISYRAVSNSRRSSIQAGHFKAEGLRSSYAQKFIMSG
jgi:DUSP domain